MKGHYWLIIYLVAVGAIFVCYLRNLVDLQTAAGIIGSLTTFLMPSPVPLFRDAQVSITHPARVDGATLKGK